MSGKVGIVLLNWNGLNDTTECISSLLKSTWDNYAIYVIDNASRGNEGDIIQSKFPMVRVLKEKENLGFCKGNNVAVTEAIQSGVDYVMLLNNDTVVPSDLIEKLVLGYESVQNVGAVSPLILDYPNISSKVQFSGAKWNSRKACFSLVDAGIDYNELRKKIPYRSEFACGCCLLTKPSVIEKVGLLDERYFAYYDEADWCYRLAKKGYKSFVIPGAEVYHRISRTNTISPVSAYLLNRNRLLWMSDHLPFSLKLKSYPRVLKEFGWHLLNRTGLKKSANYSVQESKAIILGYKDFLFRRFGKWTKSAEKVLFKK